DVDFLKLLRLGVDAAQGGFDVPELALNREREGHHRALHPLEDVHAEEVNEAFLAVNLAEEARAALDLGAVSPVVSFLLVGKHVPQRRVGSEVQATDLEIDVANRRKRATKVDVGLDVDQIG